jgi:Holliday junction resolvase
MSRLQRDKGAGIEREVVELHRDLGLHAERMPLSGAQRCRSNRADVDVYPWHPNEAPLSCKVKVRAGGKGFIQLERWLGEVDALFLRRNNAEPVVLLPWRVWARLVKRGAP